MTNKEFHDSLMKLILTKMSSNKESFKENYSFVLSSLCFGIHALWRSFQTMIPMPEDQLKRGILESLDVLIKTDKTLDNTTKGTVN